jgi:hypothetical protein
MDMMPKHYAHGNKIQKIEKLKAFGMVGKRNSSTIKKCGPMTTDEKQKNRLF